MSNKSKAQQYADYNKILVPVRPEFGDTAYVYQDGDLYLTTAKLSPEGALALRDWLTDTFDVPQDIKLGPVGNEKKEATNEDWTKDIKPGFEGRTRDGRRAVFQGIREYCPEYTWSVEGSIFSHKYESLTTLTIPVIIESDWDIIGPWKGDNK